MSTPPPRDPQRKHREVSASHAAEGPEEEYDVPYAAPPRPRSRQARPTSGAVRAFLFLAAALVIGAGIGQSLGLALSLALLRGHGVAHNAAELRQVLPDLLRQPLVITCIGGISLLLMLAVTWVFARAWDRRSLAGVGFRLDARAGQEFAVGLVLGGVLVGAIFAVEAGLGWVRVTGVMPFPASLAHALLWLGALLPAAAAEEVMLRGYPFQALREQWGGAAATVLTALAFGALHSPNPNAGWPSFAGIFVSGILFGTAVLMTGRLWLPIGLHVAWNLFEGPVLGFPVSGIAFPSLLHTITAGPALWTGGDFGPEAGLLGPLASALGVLLLLARRRYLAAGRRNHRGTEGTEGNS